MDEVGGLGGKGCVVPWPVLGDAATESVSLLASPSLLQQTFMKALSLFQIPQNVVCILHAPYPSLWGGGRNVYHGAPLRALSGSSHSAINVNSVLAGSWGRPDSACGGPLGERALHSRCSPSHVKYVSLLTAGAARLVRGSCEASCRLASFRGGAGGDRPAPRSWLPSVPAPPPHPQRFSVGLSQTECAIDFCGGRWRKAGETAPAVALCPAAPTLTAAGAGRPFEVAPLRSARAAPAHARFLLTEAFFFFFL